MGNARSVYHIQDSLARGHTCSDFGCSDMMFIADKVLEIGWQFVNTMPYEADGLINCAPQQQSYDCSFVSAFTELLHNSIF